MSEREYVRRLESWQHTRKLRKSTISVLHGKKAYLLHIKSDEDIRVQGAHSRYARLQQRLLCGVHFHLFAPTQEGRLDVFYFEPVDFGEALEDLVRFMSSLLIVCTLNVAATTFQIHQMVAITMHALCITPHQNVYHLNVYSESIFQSNATHIYKFP